MIVASKALYFEDFEPGVETQLGEYHLSQGELIEFATRYDPQPFHTDPTAANASLIGCLCASGNHTYVATQRLVYDCVYSRAVVIAGIGVDKLRFHRPVLPDESLSGHVTVISRRRSISRSDRGVVVIGVVTINPRHEMVASMETSFLVMCRPQ